MERFTTIDIYFSISKNQSREQHENMKRVIQERVSEFLSKIERECNVLPTNLLLKFRE